MENFHPKQRMVVMLIAKETDLVGPGLVRYADDVVDQSLRILKLIGGDMSVTYEQDFQRPSPSSSEPEASSRRCWFHKFLSFLPKNSTADSGTKMNSVPSSRRKTSLAQGWV